MGYYSRFTLHAIHPGTLEEVPIKDLPPGFMARFRHGLEEKYDADVPINTDGGLFSYDSRKFYEYEQAMRHASQGCPQVIWVLHIEGEEQGDQRAYYAFKGVGYEEKMTPWVPPPPNMARLPRVVRIEDVPPDPPSAREALQTSLDHMEHSSSCPAQVGAEADCNCHVLTVVRALAALAPGD